MNPLKILEDTLDQSIESTEITIKVSTIIEAMREFGGHKYSEGYDQALKQISKYCKTMTHE